MIRLNRLFLHDIIPFNFGMDYQGFLSFYDKNHETMPTLCQNDPRTWSQETIDNVNKKAKEETELVDRLMALSDDEFNAEVKRLKKNDSYDW